MKLIGAHPQQQSGSQQMPQAAEALPYLVRRGRQLVAAFAQKSEANNWARDFSNYRDSESTFYIHTAGEILSAFRDGSEVEVV